MRYDLKQITEFLAECSVKNSKGKPLSLDLVRKALKPHICHWEKRLDSDDRKQKVKTYSEMTLLKVFLSQTVHDDLSDRFQEGLIGINNVVKKVNGYKATIEDQKAQISKLEDRIAYLESRLNDSGIEDGYTGSHLRLVLD